MCIKRGCLATLLLLLSANSAGDVSLSTSGVNNQQDILQLGGVKPAASLTILQSGQSNTIDSIQSSVLGFEATVNQLGDDNDAIIRQVIKNPLDNIILIDQTGDDHTAEVGSNGDAASGVKKTTTQSFKQVLIKMP